ncbi:Phosphate acetyltransferase [Diplonema papillatum]|nr:Phosphate acetyltransferase [Diplonema papillatum]
MQRFAVRQCTRRSRKSISSKAFTEQLYANAKKDTKQIVLPEATDDRVLVAGCRAAKEGLARITLLGEPDELAQRAERLNVSLAGVNIVCPKTDERLNELIEFMCEKRKRKGLSKEQARDIVNNEVTTFGTLLVATGYADGMVSGAVHTSADTIRPALQLVGTVEGKAVSSVFFMLLSDQVYAYADCALVISPTPDQLADIAISTARTAKVFGIDPKVAMLSFSTGQSNRSAHVEPVRVAAEKARMVLSAEGIPVDGPIQFDAAVNEKIAKTKGAPSMGQNTVLVFPDLNSGNITYKAVQQATNCVAMGPILQGLKKPINDLSRGSSIADIVDTIAVTATQCRQL